MSQTLTYEHQNNSKVEQRKVLRLESLNQSLNLLDDHIVNYNRSFW